MTLSLARVSVSLAIPGEVSSGPRRAVGRPVAFLSWLGSRGIGSSFRVVLLRCSQGKRGESFYLLKSVVNGVNVRFLFIYF